MKDPTIPDASTRKKFMFYDTEQRQVELRIRCQYDNINQSQFFRMMISGYLSNDPNILKFIDSFKEKHSIQGKAKRDYVNKKHSEATANISKHGLNADELESIFDIIEMEHPEL